VLPRFKYYKLVVNANYHNRHSVHYDGLLGLNYSAGFLKKMEIIRNQRPAKAGCGSLLQNRIESFQKWVSIGIVFKNVSSLKTSAYGKMQGTRRIYSVLTWHVSSLPQTNKQRNAQFQPRPSLPSHTTAPLMAVSFCGVHRWSFW
jgi:hypothetical protein